MAGVRKAKTKGKPARAKAPKTMAKRKAKAAVRAKPAARAQAKPAKTASPKTMAKGSPYTTDLDKNPANYQALSPLSFLERAAATFPKTIAILHGEQARIESLIADWKSLFTTVVERGSK